MKRKISNKVSVAFFARRYLPHIGGVESHVYQVSKILNVQNFKITIITEQDASYEKLIEKNSYSVIYRIPINYQRNKITEWKWVFNNIRLLLNADIIHIHDVFYWILPMWPLLKLLNKKIFITFHGYENADGPSTKQVFWHLLASKLTNGNICIGGFHSLWYRVKPTIISFGATTQVYKTYISKKYPKHTLKIIFIGRIAEDTGIIQYIKSLKLIKAHFNIILDIYGDGPLRDLAEELTYKIGFKVNFKGFVSHNSIDLTQYDVAFVSRYLAIIECMAAGLPVIAQFNSAIKRDYLAISPFCNWIFIVQSPTEIYYSLLKIQSGRLTHNRRSSFNWANQQTWSLVTQQYRNLWRV